MLLFIKLSQTATDIRCHISKKANVPAVSKVVVPELVCYSCVKGPAL